MAIFITAASILALGCLAINILIRRVLRLESKVNKLAEAFNDARVGEEQSRDGAGDEGDGLSRKAAGGA